MVKDHKENYRPDLQTDLSDNIERFLSSILCGFQSVHNTQHALFKLLQSWQKELDQKGFVGTIL